MIFTIMLVLQWKIQDFLLGGDKSRTVSQHGHFSEICMSIHRVYLLSGMITQYQPVKAVKAVPKIKKVFLRYKIFALDDSEDHRGFSKFC